MIDMLLFLVDPFDGPIKFEKVILSALRTVHLDPHILSLVHELYNFS